MELLSEILQLIGGIILGGLVLSWVVILWIQEEKFASLVVFGIILLLASAMIKAFIL